ncbi:MAG: archaeosortase/exosortase family protein [Candidatus Magnetomorum sp.]|nr:archaeosortase/exosortase family protein [Candidatus Magnetomorum sp.]
MTNLRFYMKSFYHANHREIQFIVFFILFFVCGQSLYYWSKNYTAQLVVHRLNAGVSSFLINFIHPPERTKVHNNEIQSGPFRMIIEEGCEGTEGIILVVSALLAFQMPLMFKTIGIVLGTLLLYISNLVRIITLYYSLKYKPELFDILHMYIGQSFYIFVGAVFFIFWIQIGGAANDRQTQP